MKADRVLVPLDGSSLAERALPLAVDVLSDRPGATLMLLRAAATAEVGEALAYLRVLADRLRSSGLSCAMTTSVWSSAPAHAIVEAARTRRANVIVMSTRRRPGLRDAIPDSVADAVVRGTGTPVLLVPVGQGQLAIRQAAA